MGVYLRVWLVGRSGGRRWIPLGVDGRQESVGESGAFVFGVGVFVEGCLGGADYAVALPLVVVGWGHGKRPRPLQLARFACLGKRARLSARRAFGAHKVAPQWFGLRALRSWCRGGIVGR